VSAADPAREPFADRELEDLFSPLENYRRLLLAVSGGPDSTALLLLIHRWRKAQRAGPELVAATVDHQLRPESKREAVEVAKFAKSLGVPHHILVWSGKKPSKGLQEAARTARYGLLFQLAAEIEADAVLTAHMLDDQAETLLMRLACASGLSGLGGIKSRRVQDGIALVRPLLAVPKARLIAMLGERKIRYATDPSNTDKRFLRPRLRDLRAGLAAEGLGPERLALIAQRLARADEAIESIVDEVQDGIAGGVWPKSGPVEFSAAAYFRVPDEIAIRLLGRAIDQTGSEGPAELGKLETLHLALKNARAAGEALKRTLAGAVIGFDGDRLNIARAPVRTRQSGRRQ
jgi:tRNA(Ile)-lysidine synthase